MISINIGEGVDLDAQKIITSRGCVVGQSGSGKSYLVGVLVEELCKNNLPFAIVDSEGEYHNIKSRFESIWVSDDEKADLNFSVNYGDLISESVNNNVPIIFDVSDFSDSTAIVSKFLGELYDFEDKFHKPYLVIIEEADRFVPQIRSYKNQNIIEEISVRGRKRGLGLIIATQRPANVNKNVISQCNYGFIGKMVIENDINSIEILLDNKDYKKVLTKLSTGQFISFGLGLSGVIKVKGREISPLGDTPKLAVQQKIVNFDNLISEMKSAEQSKKSEKHNAKSINKNEKDLLDGRIVSRVYTLDDAKDFIENGGISLISKFLGYDIESIKELYLPIAYFKLHLPTKDLSTVKEVFGGITMDDYLVLLNGKGLKLIKSRFKALKLSNLDESILYIMRGYGRTSSDKIAKELHSDPKLFKSSLNNLIKEGLITYDGKKYILEDVQVMKSKIDTEPSFIQKEDVLQELSLSKITQKAKIYFSGCNIVGAELVYLPVYQAITRNKNKLKIKILDSIQLKDRFNEFKNYIKIED